MGEREGYEMNICYMNPHDSPEIEQRFTRYTNPSEASTMALMRAVGVVGVVSNTLHKQKENTLRKKSTRHEIILER